MALREIFANLGFSWDAATAHKADHDVQQLHGHVGQLAHGGGGFEGLIHGLQGLTAIFAGSVIGHWTHEVAEQAIAVGKLSRVTGLATDEIQALQLGARRNGVETAELSVGLRRLAVSMSSAKGGIDETGQAFEGGAKTFATLGIQTRTTEGHLRTFAEVLPELSDKLAEIKNPTEKAAAAQALFGRSGAKLLPILGQGREGIAELRHELAELGGGFSPEAIENAEEFHHATVDLDTAFFSLKSTFAVSVFPALSKIISTMTGGVARFAEWAKHTTAVETATKLLAGTVAIKLGTALAPYLRSGLKFAAIFIAVDELIGFLQGKDSEIGNLLDKAFGDGTAGEVREWVNDAIGSLGGFWEDIKSGFAGAIIDITQGFPFLSAAWEVILTRISVEFSQMLLDIEIAWNQLLASLKLPKSVTDALKFDTKDRNVQTQELTRKADRAVFRAEDISAGQKQIANSGKRTAFNISDTSNGVTTAVAPGPVRSNIQYQNSVQLNAPIQITVPQGTTADQARSIAREVRIQQDQGFRAAHQALAQRHE